MKNNKIFQLEIDDYTVPAFVSGSKFVFGYIEDIFCFCNALKTSGRCQDFVSKFNKFESNDPDAKYSIAYAPMELMHVTTLLGKKDIKEINIAWDHLNIWGFPHRFHADEFFAERIIIKYLNKIYVAIKPVFKNLSLSTTENLPPLSITENLWGFPCLYEYNEKDNTLSSRVYMIEGIFSAFSPDQKQAAWDCFNGSIVYLKAAFDEILGDG